MTESFCSWHECFSCWASIAWNRCRCLRMIWNTLTRKEVGDTCRKRMKILLNGFIKSSTCQWIIPSEQISNPQHHSTHWNLLGGCIILLHGTFNKLRGTLLGHCVGDGRTRLSHDNIIREKLGLAYNGLVVIPNSSNVVIILTCPSCDNEAVLSCWKASCHLWKWHRHVEGNTIYGNIIGGFPIGYIFLYLNVVIPACPVELQVVG